MSSMTIEARGIPFATEAIGEGRPIILVHGRRTDHRSLLPAFEPIFAERRGWRRIYVDLPGMGATPGPDWIRGQDDMLEALLAFIDATLDGGRGVLIGSSYGGYLALGAAHRIGARLDGLLLLAPSVDQDVEQRQLPAHRVFAADREAVASVTEAERVWLEIAVVQTQASLDNFRSSILPGFTIADHPFLDRVQERDSLSFEVRDFAEPFPAPALILAGRHDTAVGYLGATSLIGAFERGTLAVLDRAGHGLAGEQRPLFQALVHEWLDRVEEYAPA